MKKRILSAVLAVAILSSLIITFSITSSATTMGKTVGEMVSELTAFISEANNQIKRDDFEKMPAGMNTEHEATKKLKSLLEEAKALRKAKNEPDAEEKMDAFLVDLFGGWDTEANEGEGNYVNGNKPYGDFQDALLLRYRAIEPYIYFGEKGYSTHNREDYTLDSWNEFQAFVTEMEKEWFTVCDEYPYSRLSQASRSEAYYLVQNYYAAFDKLVKFEGDEAAKEVNKAKGLLYDLLQIEKEIGMPLEDFVARMDSDDTSAIAQEARKLLNLGDKVKARDALVKFMADAQKVYDDPKATVEQINEFFCFDLFKDTNVGTVVVPESEIKEHIEKDGWILSGERYIKPKPKKSSTGRVEKDEEGNIIYETDADGKTVYEDTPYHYNRFNKRNTLINDFNTSLFVGDRFRTFKSHRYYFPVLDEYNAGIYSKEDWNTFLKSFELGDQMLGDPKSKESDFYKALEIIKDGYEIIITKRQTENVYRPYGDALVKYFYDVVMNEEDDIEYDVDSVRHYKDMIDLYLEATDNLDKLAAENKQNTEEYKYWEEYAQARVYDLIDMKDQLVILDKSESTDIEGYSFYHNSSSILNAAKKILEKAEIYEEDVKNNGDKFNSTGKDYPFPGDTVANFVGSVKNLRQALKAIEKYEQAISEFEAAYESDPEAEPTVGDSDAVTDEKLLELINAVYFNLSSMQLEYVVYE